MHYDPERARRLLAEAGYPNGSGLPVIKGNTHFDHYSYFVEIAAQWRAELGFQVQIEVSTRLDADFFDCSLFFAGWIADFPDPHNLICQSSFITNLQRAGWQDKQYEELIQTAVSLTDRGQRMALYRQADYHLVVEEALVIPVIYSGKDLVILVKPWVNNYKFLPIGRAPVSQVIIEEH